MRALPGALVGFLLALAIVWLLTANGTIFTR